MVRRLGVDLGERAGDLQRRVTMGEHPVPNEGGDQLLEQPAVAVGHAQPVGLLLQVEDTADRRVEAELAQSLGQAGTGQTVQFRHETVVDR